MIPIYTESVITLEIEPTEIQLAMGQGINILSWAETGKAGKPVPSKLGSNEFTHQGKKVPHRMVTRHTTILRLIVIS